MDELDCLYSVNLLENLRAKGELSEEQYNKALKILHKMIADKGINVTFTEYKRIDENSFSYYNKNTKMTVELYFRPHDEFSEVIDKAIKQRVTDILSRQYIQNELDKINKN